MDFRWVKTPKNKEDEKEQFDKLYHMLVKLSNKGNEIVLPSASTAPTVTTERPNDEFTRLKMDILANFNGQTGVSIQALETCRGCNRSFYSDAERDKHLRQTPACQEWTQRGLAYYPEMDVPFFSFLEQGLSTLLGPMKNCKFCQKQILNRRAQEKHYIQSPLCNRLAHDSFRSWSHTHNSSSVPAPALLALPAPSPAPFT